MINIINLKHSKPVKEYDAVVDRTSKLGNPFYMKSEAERDNVCDKYIEYFYRNIQASGSFKTEVNRLVDLYKKHGHLNLFCWCAPKRCHAETIRKYIYYRIREDS